MTNNLLRYFEDPLLKDQSVEDTIHEKRHLIEGSHQNWEKHLSYCSSWESPISFLEVQVVHLHSSHRPKIWLNHMYVFGIGMNWNLLNAAQRMNSHIPYTRIRQYLSYLLCSLSIFTISIPDQRAKWAFTRFASPCIRTSGCPAPAPRKRALSISAVASFRSSERCPSYRRSSLPNWSISEMNPSSAMRDWRPVRRA